jgi:hypothetical protein
MNARPRRLEKAGAQFTSGPGVRLNQSARTSIVACRETVRRYEWSASAVVICRNAAARGRLMCETCKVLQPSSDMIIAVDAIVIGSSLAEDGVANF